MTTTTTQAVEKAKTGGEAMIEQYQGSFAQVLPSHVKPEMFIRVAQGLLRRTPALKLAAEKNPGSFLSALLDCARLGLEPGDTYHLVPFGNEVTGITDYTGEIELIYRAGTVSSIKAEIVYELDKFTWRPGEMERPDHRPPPGADGEPDWFSDRGKMRGVYAYGVMKDGGTSRVIVMSEADVNRHKAIAKGTSRSDSPWKLWPESMWLKTAVKQLKKWVPSSAEYREQALRAEAAAQQEAGVLGVSLPSYDAPDIPAPNDGDEDIVDAEVVEDHQADANGVAVNQQTLTEEKSA